MSRKKFTVLLEVRSERRKNGAGIEPRVGATFCGGRGNPKPSPITGRRKGKKSFDCNIFAAAENEQKFSGLSLRGRIMRPENGVVC